MHYRRLQILAAGLASTAAFAGCSSSADAMGKSFYHRLELRPVAAVSVARCAAHHADQPPQKTLILRSGADGRCLVLGRALLSISRPRAGLTAQVRSYGERDFVVVVPLNKAQGKVYAHLASSYLHKQVAFVMFGRIVSAPTIESPILPPELEVATSSRKNARAIADSLNG